MNFRFIAVETSLNRAEFRWKWLRFLRWSFVLGTVLCGGLMLFAGAVLAGWVTNRAWAITFLVLTGVLAAIAWVVVLLGVMASGADRNRLAAALEKVDRRLMDRLHTLLFLEPRRGDREAESFALRIARQAQTILSQKTVPAAFPEVRPARYAAVFLVALTATLLLYHVYSPMSRLVAAQNIKPAKASQPEKQFDLAGPTTNNVEQAQPWGEVRITEPGTDLKLTKVDVVPLQIEAAANQALKSVGWSSAVNGNAEEPHALPPPSESRYGVYQPTLYMDELRLSDWDVVSYYAKASTEMTNSYASEVYFLEVRPFREDLMKLPGGESGKPYQSLSEMSSLIERQEQVIRQTHQYVQKPPEPENLRAQDRNKLSDAEGDLGDAARHLYAQMASGMENKSIGEALDNLAKASQSLGDASQLLKTNSMPEAQSRERTALTELVAARKVFQKAVSDNPKAFEEQKQDGQSPVADSSQKLSQMAEFRNESKAAQDFVDKALQQQRSLERQAEAKKPGANNHLANEEEKLRQSLAEFDGQHPQAFKSTDAQYRKTQQAMADAKGALQRSANETQPMQEATRQLEQLAQQMQAQSAGQQLANAYNLKQMLDQKIQQFDKMSKPDGAVSKEDQYRAASQAQETVNQMRDAAQQDPTRNAFGEPLREALSGANKAALDSKLSRLGRPQTLAQVQDGASQQQRAADARDALGKVSQAFDQSQPQALQAARKNDSLKPSAQESLNQGMSQLDSLVRQMEDNRPIPAEDRDKQGRQALYNLQTGMREVRGNNQEGEQILAHLDKMLKGEQPLDRRDLKKLQAELQNFSLETASQLAKKEDQPDLRNIDPSRLPPAYRGRIQKYFEKLSEE